MYILYNSNFTLPQACTEMSLPCDTNNVTDMFPPTTFDPSEYCMNTWGASHRKGWMDTQFWGKGGTQSHTVVYIEYNYFSI